MAKIPRSKKNTQKDFILKRAAKLFRLKGFKATSMRELAETLGIEAPSLYNHITSKDELLQDVCFKVAEKFIQYLNSIEESSGGTIAKLESIIRFHIKMMLENFDEVFVANHDWKYLQESYLNNFLIQRRDYEKRLVVLVEKGIRSKELKNTNPYIVVLTILSAVRGLEFWQRQKKNISAEVLENTMITQLLNGIIK